MILFCFVLFCFVILKSSSRLEHPMGVRQPVDAKNAGRHLRLSSRGFSFFKS